MVKNKGLFEFAVHKQSTLNSKETFIKLLDLIIRDIGNSNNTAKEEVEVYFINFYEEIKTNIAFNEALNERHFLKSLIERKNIEKILCNF